MKYCHYRLVIWFVPREHSYPRDTLTYLVYGYFDRDKVTPYFPVRRTDFDLVETSESGRDLEGHSVQKGHVKLKRKTGKDERSEGISTTMVPKEGWWKTVCLEVDSQTKGTLECIVDNNYVLFTRILCPSFMSLTYSY